MIAIGMGVLVLFLLRILRNNREAFKETLTAYLKFELILGFEISASDHCIMTLPTGLPTAAFSRHGKGSAGCDNIHAHVCMHSKLIALLRRRTKAACFSGCDLLDITSDTLVVVSVHQSGSDLAIW
jgi:hypothetical protein